jgi:hypothetical protein
MSETCPTVKVKSANPEHEQGFIVINESDFDAATQELFVEPDADADAEPKKAAAKKKAATE